MSKIRTIIIDDEPTAIENLELLIENYCPDIDIVGTATSIDTGIKIINQKKPELLFLDVHIDSDGNGLELLSLLPQKTFQTIFVTAHSEYAIPAFKQHAFDYILKPVDYKELIKCISDFQQNKISKLIADNVLATSLIPIHTEKCTHLLRDSDIEYCEANGSYTKIILVGNNNVTISKSIKHIESLLNKNRFQRIHRSYIVSIDKVLKILKSDGELLTTNGSRVPLSIKYLDSLYSKINKLK